MAKPNQIEEGIFDVNEHKLDEGWLEQPKLVGEYSRRLADARKALDLLKNQAKVLKAEHEKTQSLLYLKITASPEDYGMSKTTEASVKAAMLQQAEYEESQEQINDCDTQQVHAKYLVDLLEGVMGALSDRRRALENLVSLHLAGYYSEPRISGVEGEEGRERMAEVEKRAIRRKGRDR